MRYDFPVGDVLVYERIFDTENSLLERPDVSYTVQEKWLIKAAVVDRDGSSVGLAIQANRTALRINGRAGLERAVGGDDAANILALYERAETVSVRYETVDEFGRSLNRSYSLQDAASFVAASMQSLFSLPAQPVWEGWSATSSGEQPMDIVYEGLRQEGGAARHVFSGRHPAGWALMSVDRDLSLPAKLEYAADYGGANERRREHVSIRLTSVQKDAYRLWDRDPAVERALVLGALARSGLVCRAAIIKRFLDGSDVQKQNLAAAYCAQRGIPDGLDMTRYLYAKNPIVRFNAAKAIYRFGGNAKPLIMKMRDYDPYVARRAAGFFHAGTDVLPPDRTFAFWVLQNWLYNGGDLPDIFQEDPDYLRDLVRFLKPANDAVGGCYRSFLARRAGGLPSSLLRLPARRLRSRRNLPDARLSGHGRRPGGPTPSRPCTTACARPAPCPASSWWCRRRTASGGMRTWSRSSTACSAAVLKTLSVDTNQLYLAGSSNGGMGTIYFGTRLPDRFAGLASNMGYPVVDRRFLEQPQNLEVLQNLSHASVFLSHGSRDDTVTPQGDRETADLLRKADGSVVLREWPRKRHNIDIREVIDDILEVFASGRRNPYPRRIDFVLTDPAYSRCFWVDAEGAPAGAEVHARVTDNTIDVQAVGVGRLRLYLDEKLVDLARDVVVRVNGRESFRGRVHPTADDMLFSLAKTADAQAVYSAYLEVGVQQ